VPLNFKDYRGTCFSHHTAVRTFTPTEAALLTGLPLKAVNNAIDKKTVSAVAGDEGHLWRRYRLAGD
jgi:hypothetical protein